MNLSKDAAALFFYAMRSGELDDKPLARADSSKLREALKAARISHKAAGEMIGRSRQTVGRYIEHPELFTIDDAWTLGMAIYKNTGGVKDESSPAYIWFGEATYTAAIEAYRLDEAKEAAGKLLRRLPTKDFLAAYRVIVSMAIAAQSSRQSENIELYDTTDLEQAFSDGPDPDDIASEWYGQPLGKHMKICDSIRDTK